MRIFYFLSCQFLKGEVSQGIDSFLDFPSGCLGNCVCVFSHKACSFVFRVINKFCGQGLILIRRLPIIFFLMQGNAIGAIGKKSHPWFPLKALAQGIKG